MGKINSQPNGKSAHYYKLMILLIFYHLLFSFAAFHFVSTNGGDAKNYWFLNEHIARKNWQDFFYPGTDIVRWITFPFVKYFHFPFWSGFFVFSLFSSLGLVLLYRLMADISADHRVLKYYSAILLLLPNIHFWSSFIGKEALLLPFFVLIILKLKTEKYFSPVIFGAFFFIALVRPHVAFVLILSYVLSLLIVIKSAMKDKLMLIGILGVCTVLCTVILFQIQNFDGGFQRIIKKYDTHIQYFKQTDAYVPLDQYGFLMKIFTFYFRPLPFEKAGWGYGIVSFENAILLLFFVGTSLCTMRYIKILCKQILFVFPVILLLLFASMYVFAYANYGIIIRTKMMVLPFLYVLILTIISSAILSPK